MEPLAVPRDMVARNMYEREVSIMEGRCLAPPIGCGRDITFAEHRSWDALTQKEYTLSGWCNTCQDKVFVDPDESELECCCVTPCSEVDIGVGIMTCSSAHCTCDGDGNPDPPEFIDRIYDRDFEEYWRIP